MQTVRHILLFINAYAFVMMPLPSFGQRLIGSIQTNVVSPQAIATNSAANKVYVADKSSNNVAVIDGETNQATAVPVGSYPYALAVNTVTNKIYVANVYDNTVTVIDGATLTTNTVSVGSGPVSVAVNCVTNKIYVANTSDNTVTVIDGVSLATLSVIVGDLPQAVAVNPVTNEIYVGDERGIGPSEVTVIDGVTNHTVTLELPHRAYFGYGNNDLVVNSTTNQIYANGILDLFVIDGTTNHVSGTTLPPGTCPLQLGVNPTTNKIYLPDLCQGTIIVVDGTTLSTTTVSDENYPVTLSIDSVTNKVYVVNQELQANGGSLTVVDGVTDSTITLDVEAIPLLVAANPVTNTIYTGNDNSVSVVAGAAALQFVPVTPCRLLDTRQSGGPIRGGTSQSFLLPQLGGCNIPNSAAAYSLNVTVVPQVPLEYLTIWPSGEPQPFVSTMNSVDGRVKANAVIVPAGAFGGVNVYVTDTTDLILDIDGYFAPVSNSTLAFYPLAPCRVADTRDSNYPEGLGPPSLTGGVPRDFPVLEATSCNIPSSAKAYSLNFTAAPHGPLGYLTVWPTGEQQPNVSTLNAPTGAATANAAIVPAGTSGSISTFAFNDTDLIIDINGYFAAPGQGGFSLYPVAPCRVFDTRLGHGAFNGTLTPPVDIVNSSCGVPSTSQAYVFNATVVPKGSLGYLTLWPDGGTQPYVSTLNAYDGAITSNMAIVPAGTAGKVDAYADGLTNLILDISSYFAP